MPADEQATEPRRKRAKIVSACSECRRKKTKCNGEQPCRNCQKSAVPCVYPSSHNDDRRNAPSKAALEAIEERLKTIEDMLKTILQSNLPVANLDPVTVNNFLNKDRNSSSPVPSSSRTTLIHPPSHPPPSTPSPPHPPMPSQPLTQAPPQTPGTPHELRLPSIHNLSAPSAYSHQLTENHENRDLPPLGLQDYHLYPYKGQSPATNSSKSENEDYALQPIKKRKR
ncbi:hypothetical protein EC973_002659 [Apophysomyces ossiformis]|uniref:Zn(2)-C6 fungal-type domain-containing protein n=1 Tax=Apophysomyces ossiformis TaxID=679940 RepID=A0A8H7BKB6_9FUNG|nr:hypothetical protein EC973_002659 [Apophysomyces ossiformis]